jgi:hypothetical protein
MDSFRVKVDREPDAGLFLVGSALFLPVRFVISAARVAAWLAVPLAAPWLLARVCHWPLSWTYAIWEMGAATAFVVAFTLRAREDHPAPTVDDWLADVFVAGHWPFAVLAAAAYGPWLLVRGLAGGAATKEPSAPRAGTASRDAAALSVPVPGAGDKARSRHSAPPFRAATPRP